MERVVRTIAELAALARDFVERYPRGAIVGLSGDLGVGKTTFVREVIALLSSRQGITPPRVVSPSFVLHQSYRQLSPPVDHFDLYRLTDADDTALTEIGLHDAIDEARRSGGFVFIEWPEHARVLPLDLTLRAVLEGESRRWTLVD